MQLRIEWCKKYIMFIATSTTYRNLYSSSTPLQKVLNSSMLLIGLRWLKHNFSEIHLIIFCFFNMIFGVIKKFNNMPNILTKFDKIKLCIEWCKIHVGFCSNILG
jgi:hypothetical protein